MTTVNVQEVAAIKDHNDKMHHNDYASDILRCHYSTLSQSLQYPIKVARLLQREGVISQSTLNNVKTTAQFLSTEEATLLLLKSIRHAVHTNYYNLAIFASILLKHAHTVPCAKAILNDFSE